MWNGAHDMRVGSLSKWSYFEVLEARVLPDVSGRTHARTHAHTHTHTVGQNIRGGSLGPASELYRNFVA